MASSSIGDNNSMSKKHCLMITEMLSHDEAENILEKLPVKSLVRFKSVSKQWKSTIESRYFQERQLKYCQNSRIPNILLMNSDGEKNGLNIKALNTTVFEPSASVKIPTPLENIVVYAVSASSCDGLIFLHNYYHSVIVVNPTTRWHRSFPPPRLKQLNLNGGVNVLPLPFLGFGKDKFKGTYKPVWLYNSSESDLENATTCEVFDFSTNAWRYITASSPWKINPCHDPVYVDGSLHWFTNCKETKVLSLDLHTETFQILSKVPFLGANRDIVMCNLDNRLCVAEKKWPNQVIWTFDSGNKTWEKMYSIGLDETSLFGKETMVPLAVLEKKKKKKNLLLFSSSRGKQTMVVHDPETKSCELAFTAQSIGYNLVCYFESLVSIS